MQTRLVLGHIECCTAFVRNTIDGAPAAVKSFSPMPDIAVAYARPYRPIFVADYGI
jgi:hypothetical protein